MKGARGIYEYDVAQLTKGERPVTGEDIRPAAPRATAVRAPRSATISASSLSTGPRMIFSIR